MKSKYSTFETVLDVIIAICLVVGLFSSAWLLLWSIYTLVFAIVSKKIGESKGLDYGFLVGWFLGIIGLIIICVLPNENTNNVVRNSNKYEDLEKLHKLKEQGVITEKEFENEKNKLLK